MQRAPHILSSATILTCFVAGLVLSACKQSEAPIASAPDEAASELKWARAALERNPELKVISVDKERNSIKVMIKASGETTNLTPGELAALPIGDLVALTNSVNAAHDAAASKVVEESIPVTPPPENEAAATIAPPANSSASAPTATDYKIERQDGRVRVSGPGMNIEATNSNGQPPALGGRQRFDEPIICEGPRMLHLDHRRLKIDGDAIIARGGCELHLTNSEISATGTAIVIQDATVHIGNSLVLGGAASFDAGPEAKLFMQNTRFTGTARRDAAAKITDQGGNFWR